MLLGLDWQSQTGVKLDASNRAVEFPGWVYHLEDSDDETEGDDEEHIPMVNLVEKNEEDFVTEALAHDPVSNILINPDLDHATKLLAEEVAKEFEGLVVYDKGSIGHCKLVKHKIRTINDDPVYTPSYKLTQKEEAFISTEVRRLIDIHVLQESISSNNPPLLIKKPDGDYRFVNDFRALNKVTISDQFPIPNIDKLLMSLRLS
jgi:hypothetical protein